ncbi:MAG: DUF3305 domain-containing protein [Rhodobacteraceae bacterium]|nr:DUF3305 domain-containing protein [Paracoccaceae bacterium]
MPLGIVIRKTPGVTRWSKWSWKVVGVLPGAGPAEWRVLRTEGDAIEYHATTTELELFHTDTEAYLNSLSAQVPAVYVVLRDADGPDALEEISVLLATASPYEAQDYMDTGEEIVEQVPMPEGLVAWVRDFAQAHHEDEVFVKRKRDKKRVDLVEDGKGDPRITQLSDVYRAPQPQKREPVH